MSAFGFRLSGTLTSVGRKHGRWLDTVPLQRPFGEGGGTAPAEGEHRRAGRGMPRSSVCPGPGGSCEGAPDQFSLHLWNSADRIESGTLLASRAIVPG